MQKALDSLFVLLVFVCSTYARALPPSLRPLLLPPVRVALQQLRVVFPVVQPAAGQVLEPLTGTHSTTTTSTHTHTHTRPTEAGAPGLVSATTSSSSSSS